MSDLTEIKTYDSFVFCLYQAINQIDPKIDLNTIYGKVGLGSRFTLAMNVKTGKEIGHPSTEFIWDIISFIENCFEELGVNSEVYVDGDYLTSARNTSAEKHEVPNFVNYLDDNDILIGPIIYPKSDGIWIFEENEISPKDIPITNYPFGRIFIRIIGLTEVDFHEFPRKSLAYIIKTLERGEEPMELMGLGGYSALSGWKAFARWMQAYSLPIKGIKHTNLENIGHQLAIRRRYYANYWLNSIDFLEENKEKEYAVQLANAYQEIANYADLVVKDGQTYSNIKQLYYIEQKTLPIFKAINHYLNLNSSLSC